MNFNSINWLYIGIVSLVFLAIAFAWADKQRIKLLAKFASAKLMPDLSRTVSPTKIFIKKILFALGVFAVFLALARPQWGYRWEETKSKGIDIIFAIDTSKSMLAEDVKPSRLERAKLSVLDLLNVLNGDRIGIVAFSGQAFLQCPLTLDYDAFRMSLEALDTNVIQRGGTNISAAIDEAEIAFAKTSNKKIIVLISDGEELESSALTRAKDAAKKDVVIYTLGVGGVKGEAIPVRDSAGRITQLRDENGKIVTSKLNEKVLTQIANVTDGFYEPLTANGMDTIYEEGLKKIPQHELSARMKQLAIERFQIPLAIAIILLALESLVGTRRFFTRKNRTGIMQVILLSIISIFLLNPQETEAAEESDTKQNQAEVSHQEKTKSEAKQNELDMSSPIEVFNAGIDSIKENKKSEAKQLFEESIKVSPEDFSLHAKAFYNIANIDYEASKHSLATAISAKESTGKIGQIDQSISMAISQGTNLIEQGTPLLKQEQEALAKAKTEDEKKKALESSPLKNQQFQQQLKQGIGMCDNVEKEFANIKKSISENISKWKNADNTLTDAIGNYKSTITLDSNFIDAKKNLDVAKKAKKNLELEIEKNKELYDAVDSDIAKQKLENVAKVKEELKKLLRDDNNQNNQDNQQQNQNQDQQNNQQNQQQNQNQQNQNDENKNDEKDSQKNDSSDNNKDEQAVKNQPQKEQNEQKQNDSENQKKDKQQKGNREEMPVKQKKEGQKESGTAAEENRKESDEKEKENFRATVGAMTKGEAKQLLESMKDSDKILPLRGYGEQNDRYEKSYKDW